VRKPAGAASKNSTPRYDCVARTSNSSEPATCAITRAFLPTNCRRLPPPAIPGFNADERSGRLPRNAGASPNRMALATAIPAVNRSTRGSKLKSSTTGISVGMRNCEKRSAPVCATEVPKARPQTR